MPLIPNFNVEWSCVHCKVIQSVYVGDPEDLTIPDREAVRCYSCHKLELTMSEEDFRLYHGIDENVLITQELIQEFAFIEDGQIIV